MEYVVQCLGVMLTTTSCVFAARRERLLTGSWTTFIGRKEVNVGCWATEFGGLLAVVCEVIVDRGVHGGRQY